MNNMRTVEFMEAYNCPNKASNRKYNFYISLDNKTLCFERVSLKKAKQLLAKHWNVFTSEVNVNASYLTKKLAKQDLLFENSLTVSFSKNGMGIGSLLILPSNE